MFALRGSLVVWAVEAAVPRWWLRKLGYCLSSPLQFLRCGGGRRKEGKTPLHFRPA